MRKWIQLIKMKILNLATIVSNTHLYFNSLVPLLVPVPDSSLSIRPQRLPVLLRLMQNAFIMQSKSGFLVRPSTPICTPPQKKKKFRADWRHFHRPCASCGNVFFSCMPTLVFNMLTNTTLYRLGFVNSYILIAFVDSCRDNKLSLSGRLLFWIGGKVIRRQDPLEWAWTKERQITKIPSVVFIRGNTRISYKEFAEDKHARDCKSFTIFVLPA